MTDETKEELHEATEASCMCRLVSHRAEVPA